MAKSVIVEAGYTFDMETFNGVSSLITLSEESILKYVEEGRTHIQGVHIQHFLDILSKEDKASKAVFGAMNYSEGAEMEILTLSVVP